MRVGLDAIVLRGRDAGTLRYLEQLLSGLANHGAGHDYRVYAERQAFGPDVMPRAANFTYHYVQPGRLWPRALYQQFYRSWHAGGRLDLLHCAAFVPPLSYDGKTVATIFDLTFALYPETKKWTGRLWWRVFGRKGIEKADRVIALSESTKTDLVRILGIPADKVQVVYPCTDEIFRPTACEPMKAKYRLPDKYILYVGTLERRKNIANLVRAFHAAQRIGGFDHALVLAGQRGWLYEDVFRTVEELGLKERVLFLDYVPDEDLPGLYSGAALFAFLSRYEGFGFPALEAMACGVPVLAANSSSLPEVTGDAAVLISPDEVDHAAREMVCLLSDRDLRREMIEKGLRQAASFTRARMARGTLAVYKEAAG